MAVSGIQPFIKVTDSNGVPIVGAKLHVYEAGTTTYRNIYSDDGLSVALSNPLSGANASDASGDFPRFYMAAGTYKLRAVTSADVLIWEKDNIDTGLAAGSGALPVASGGTGGTTAAAARTNLGVPASSEITALASDITDIQSTLGDLVNIPQGRLTLTSGTPVLSTGVTSGTAVYYTPYIGTGCPVYDGAQFNSETFAELTLTLHSSHTLNSIFDCFIINDSGTIRIVTGPAWTTISAGSGARGTGAGTTELTRVNGLLVNANALSGARNGSSTYSVDANKATYVGSLYIDGTAGQITCHTAAGQSRKWGVWNAYNRVPIMLKMTDASASWTNTPTTWRQSRADATNFIHIFSGLAEEQYDLLFTQNVRMSVNANNSTSEIGIGYNSTSALSGKKGSGYFESGVAATVLVSGCTLVATHTAAPALGINAINAIEQAPSGTTNNTFVGTEVSMLLIAKWRG